MNTTPASGWVEKWFAMVPHRDQLVFAGLFRFAIVDLRLWVPGVSANDLALAFRLSRNGHLVRGTSAVVRGCMAYSLRCPRGFVALSYPEIASELRLASHTSVLAMVRREAARRCAMFAPPEVAA